MLILYKLALSRSLSVGFRAEVSNYRYTTTTGLALPISLPIRQHGRGWEPNPPDDPPLNPALANLHSKLSQLLSAHFHNAILLRRFEPALHGLSSPRRGHIIGNIPQQINFPFIQRRGPCKNSARGSELGFWKECANVTKHPPLLFIVLHSRRKSRGASKCRNRISGDNEAPVMLYVPQGRALGSFSFFGALIYWSSRLKETSVHWVAHILLIRTLKCVTHAERTEIQLHRLRSCTSLK